MAERTKAEEAFIDQYTRKLMVEWAKQSLAFGSVNEPTTADLKSGMMVYFDFALSKGWLSKREPHRLTAKGFGVAASFLKR
jgi:hypothetical protein